MRAVMLAALLIATATLTTAGCTTQAPAPSTFPTAPATPHLPGPLTPTAAALSPSASMPPSPHPRETIASPSSRSSPPHLVASASPRATVAATSPRATVAATPSATSTPLLVEQLDVGDARQVLTVTSASWASTTATLRAFEKTADGWRQVFGPMPAHLGYNGFSADKHEGDGTTPTGRFGFTMMFGQRPDPGVHFPYRVPDSQSVWVDDVHSPYYNTWQENAALKGEHLASPGYSTAYAYAAVIAYNMNPVVPGRGSAIFLHVDTGGPTAGCVSVSRPNLLEILRWMRPDAHPVIVMAPASVIARY
ncbi:MAG: L,D-transpeptidase family protein [Acidothermus sp.]|nr:L,D-transpeptidase family protein [Acidothermus sp.]